MTMKIEEIKSTSDMKSGAPAPDSGPSEPPAQRPSPGPSNGRDPQTGQFKPGNRFALRHGARSERHIERLKAAAQEALAEQRQEIVTDLGGADALSRIQADLVERYVTASCLLAWMEGELTVKGPLTAKGARRALHSAYATQLDRVVKLAGMLGLERRAAKAATIRDWIASKRESASAPETHEPEADDNTGNGARSADRAAGGHRVGNRGPEPAQNTRKGPRPGQSTPRAGRAVPLPGVGHDGAIPEAELHEVEALP